MQTAESVPSTSRVSTFLGGKKRLYARALGGGGDAGAGVSIAPPRPDGDGVELRVVLSVSGVSNLSVLRGVRGGVERFCCSARRLPCCAWSSFLAVRLRRETALARAALRAALCEEALADPSAGRVCPGPLPLPLASRREFFRRPVRVRSSSSVSKREFLCRLVRVRSSSSSCFVLRCALAIDSPWPSCFILCCGASVSCDAWPMVLSSFRRESSSEVLLLSSSSPKSNTVSSAGGSASSAVWGLGAEVDIFFF
mmetsp:Transcript_20525/g.48467  ORF Transcript_20525/g.48467 Transcript_20525/m.48467 type:complete len:254 (-) Transcript_20525:104-865(-)